jgi:hypothetical protein
MSEIRKKRDKAQIETAGRYRKLFQKTETEVIKANNTYGNGHVS